MSPTSPVLPVGTTLGKSYEYGLDINIGTLAEKVWQPARRISNFQPTPTATKTPAQTYDDFGAPNNTVTGWGWALAFAIQVNRSMATGLYVPEVEALLARTKPSAKGEAAVIEVRWYHKPEKGAPNPTDAGQGLATVSPARANIGPDGAVEGLNFTLEGQGPYTEIENPFTGWGNPGAPVVGSITPSGAAAGELITVTGSGLLGATAVKFAAASAVHQVLSDATIAAVVPTGSAGPVAVTVVTPGGTSDAYSYTRGA